MAKVGPRDWNRSSVNWSALPAAPQPQAEPIQHQCPRCFGRGYCPEKRRPSKKNPYALGFYARTCPRCWGTGAIDAPKEKK